VNRAKVDGVLSDAAAVAGGRHILVVVVLLKGFAEFI